MKNRRIFTLAAMFAGTLFLCAAPSDLAAAAKRKNPTSKVFIAEAKGQSQIDTGEKIEPLSKKSVYSAEGTAIETKADGSGTVVFSNGTSLYVGPNTRFEVKKFLQEPFSPNRNDLDAEPSISHTAIKLLRGSVGVCTSRLVAGSSMSYTTPHGTVNVRGHKILIEVTETETRVSLVEGDVTVLGSDFGASHNLKPGERAVLRKDSPDQPSKVEVSAMSADTNTQADNQVALACISRRTVYFEVAEREGEDAELQAVELVPAELPVNFTVSPATLP